MSLVEINWKPTDRQLRQFGIICFGALPFLSWLWGGNLSTVGWFAAVGFALALTGWVLPRALKYVFIALIVVTIPIGLVVGELAMLIIFLFVFLPIGVIFKLAKRDGLQLKLDRSATTYWQVKKQPRNVSSYYHQF